MKGYPCLGLACHSLTEARRAPQVTESSVQLHVAACWLRWELSQQTAGLPA